MAHGRDLIADFTNGETRMLYAGIKDAPLGTDLVYLVDGTATEQRPYTKEFLRCLVPTCPTPAMNTVARAPRARDGFRHETGRVDDKDHREGAFHIQGKATLARWARGQHPDATITIEAVLPGRERVADVLVTFASGERVALEVQYAGLSVAEWQERTESYERLGVKCAWLFGHFGEQLNHKDDRAHLNAIQRQLAEAGDVVLWLNPLTEQVAVAYTTTRVWPTIPGVDLGDGGRYDDVTFYVPATTIGRLEVEPLSDARLTPDGVSTVNSRNLVRQRARWEAVQAGRAAGIVEHEARERALIAIKVAERAAAEQRMRDHHAAIAARRKELRAHRYAERGKALAGVLMERFPGGPPHFLTVPTEVTPTQPADQARVWQGHLWSQWVDVPVGTQAKVKLVVKDLDRLGLIDERHVGYAAEQWLAYLHAHHMVRLEGSLFTITDPVAEEPERLAAVARDRQARLNAVSSAPPWQLNKVQAAAPTASQPCRLCGELLAGLLIDGGDEWHPSCANKW